MFVAEQTRPANKLRSRLQYDDSHPQTGIALIICIQDFDDPNLPSRGGALKDKQVLSDTFKKLGFSIHYPEGDTYVEILKKARKGNNV